MEISELKDRIAERKNLLKDRIYKWRLMRQFGDACPRCSRKFIAFSVHPECYKKFVVLSRSRKRSRILNRKAGKNKCVVCGNVAVKGQRHYCEFCGYYK